MTGEKERELGPGETQLAFAPMHLLRPHIESAHQFVTQVNEFQRPQGYRLVASFAGDETNPVVVAAAGFRRLRTLAWGDLLYIDDLSTLESHRGRGHASRLLSWVLDEARRLGCEQVHLDSAPHRHPAHRLYLSEGYHISSFHFSRGV